MVTCLVCGKPLPEEEAIYSVGSYGKGMIHARCASVQEYCAITRDGTYPDGMKGKKGNATDCLKLTDESCGTQMIVETDNAS